VVRTRKRHRTGLVVSSVREVGSVGGPEPTTPYSFGECQFTE
jgi:hypothetical protein